jgi:hypothetical protein
MKIADIIRVHNGYFQSRTTKYLMPGDIDSTFIHAEFSRRALLLNAGLLLLPLPAASEDAERRYWWHEFPSFAQTSDPDLFFRTLARMDICHYSVDPTWGLYAQHLTVIEQGKEFARIKARGARVIAWIEGFGDCMLYAVTLEKRPDGSFTLLAENPPTARVMRNHWCWANREIPQGNTFRWVGLHNAVNDEDFIRPAFTREKRGLPVPIYPDGRTAVGWIEGAQYPLNARVYDACGAKDINGSLHPAFEAPASVNEIDPATGRRKGPVEGLYPAVPGKDDVAPVSGQTGEPVSCGVISVHKDLSAPFWREYARVSVREMLRRGLDGVWCDNYSPWDNFGYPPVQKAFGDWSVHRFHEWLKGLPQSERRRLSLAEADNFDVRTYLKTKAAEFGAKDPARYDDPAWSDARWLDEPVWNAFKAFRQRAAQEDLKAFYDAIHAEARKAGRPDFCIGGNDIPLYGLGWTRDGWLDMVNTELTPGWHMGTGTRGIMLPPKGKMAVVYRAAREHQKGPFVAAWYYLNQSAEKYRRRPEIAKVLMAEAFASGAFLLCDPANSTVAGTVQSHAWWNRFVQKNEQAFGRRVPMADVGILFSPDNQLARLAPGGFPDMDDQPPIFGHWGWATAMIDAHIPYRVITDWKLDAKALAGLRVFIVPDAECLNDRSVRVLEQWMRAGGRIVATGAIGEREGPSGHFRRRQRDPAFGIRYAGDAQNRQYSTGKGRLDWIAAPLGMNYYLRAADRPALLPRLRDLVGPSTLADGAGLPVTVGLSLWRSEDGQALCADLVNYDLDADADRVRPAENLDFRVRLPIRWRGVRAVTLSPDGEAPADVRIENGWAVARLPRLIHYAGVKLIGETA